jgi:lysozyme
VLKPLMFKDYMKINDAGLGLINGFEGCRLKAYKDIVGVWTIGWGHTGDLAYEGNEIDQATADALLCEDLEVYEQGVEKRLKVKVNDRQFSALVCFAYNVGLGAFGTSTLLKLLNSGDFKGAAGQFEKWNRAGGKEVAGLTRRRKAERKLFES